MNPTPTAVLLVAAAYLLGSIPFGVLVARSRGVDLFRAGSGNIGATNVGRVLGRRWGLLVFLLDLGKGVLGVAMVDAIAPRVPGALTAFGPPDMLRVAAALAVFLGHLFPVYLGFRGGKGVATGAGTVLVLLPGPALVAVLVWLAVVSSTRLVSLGSLAAALALVAGRLLTVARPFSGDSVILTVFTLAGTALVYFKHRSNILRLISGTENRVRDTDMWRTLSKALHVLALGTWLGSAVFFNFLAAPTIFATFREVVETAPNDRTAGLPLLTTEDPKVRPQQAAQLASGLAGAAVGPLFPIFFALQAVCGVVALATAVGWCCSWPRRAVDRVRAWVVGLALLTVAVGWPISEKVSALRLERLSSDPGVAEAAREAFAEWHLVSLLLSFVTAILVLVATAMAAKMPEGAPASPNPERDLP